MARSEPTLVLVRHGRTEWSENGRHTGTTDLPLLESGIERARALAGEVDHDRYALVLSSPLQRARRTAELAGFDSDRIELCEDLREWNYGDYEGLTSPQIHESNPSWSLWRDGAPGGETPEQVGGRADRVIARAVEADGDVIMFAHGHILRVVAARWVGQPVTFGAHIQLYPATFSKLGHEHGGRTLETWNAEPR